MGRRQVGDRPRYDRGGRSFPEWESAVIVAAAGLLVAGLVFLYLWQGTILSRLRAERAQAILRVEALERTRVDLVFQVDRAYSLEEITRRARALGMGPFDEKRTRYVVIGEGGAH